MYRRDGQLLPSELGGAGIYDASLDAELGLRPKLLTQGFVNAYPPAATAPPHVWGVSPQLLTDGFGLGDESEGDDDVVPPPDTPMYAPAATGDVYFYRSGFWRAASLAGTVIGAYHGFKRNNSVGWAVGWGALGALFPIFVIPIAVAQGIGKPKR